MLNGYHETDDSMHIEKCVSLCKEKNFSFAGVQNGNQCYCGDEAPIQSAPARECHLNCAGDTSQKCGGHWRMNVYTITPRTTTIRTTTTRSTTTRRTTTTRSTTTTSTTTTTTSTTTTKQITMTTTDRKTTTTQVVTSPIKTTSTIKVTTTLRPTRSTNAITVPPAIISPDLAG